MDQKFVFRCSASWNINIFLHGNYPDFFYISGALMSSLRYKSIRLILDWRLFTCVCKKYIYNGKSL